MFHLLMTPSKKRGMCELLDQNAAPTCVHVEAGTYSIGNDSIPQAGPRHQVSLNEFWIDAFAVSLAHLEVFIASGGYFESRWWSDSPKVGRTFLDSGSIVNVRGNHSCQGR